MNVSLKCFSTLVNPDTCDFKESTTYELDDGLGSADKEKVLPNVEDLRMLLSEMSDRVENLKTECPSDWSPVKGDIEKGSVDMRGKYEETMDYIGKASPVSIAG